MTIIIDPAFKALIPPLAADELRQLEENILRDGCRDPLVVWDGRLIDGHNRYEICTRNSIPFKTIQKDFADSDEAMDWMDANQLGRRNLKPDAFTLILGRRYNRAKYKHGGRRERPKKPTFDETRAALFPEIETAEQQTANCDEASAQNEHLKTAEKIAVEHGVSSATVRRAGEFADAVEEVKKSQPEVVAQGEAAILREAKKIKRQRKEKRMEERREKAEKALEENHSTTDPDFRLILGDLLEAGVDIADESVDVIVTDPPYPEEFLETFSKLSELAARVLKPGGHCLVMSGQSHLPEVYARLCENLKYQWTLNYYTPGQSTQVFGRKVKSNWKPVIWLIKGKNDWEHIQDTVRSDENDKRFHKWGQSVSGIAKLIELFSVQNQTVFDPFVGGGTTAIAALVTGRKFIGIDIDPLCIAMSSKRIAETRQ
jgi:site-specific DNA-methyltransferase (adenine-specific)